MSSLRLFQAACALGALCTTFAAAPALAENGSGQAADVSLVAASADFTTGQERDLADPLAVFAPKGDPIRHRIDYEIWDYALKQTTLSMGPPNRKIARRTFPTLGSYILKGPQSQYRLEGSLVLFSFLEEEVIESFTLYREDLEKVAATLDIAALPRNEQLAFWFNLHNVAVMEQLAKAWPVREPRALEVDGVPLDQAKFITLRGTPVSLRDIRENIVFRHWKDPKVIYGFWRGEIGGPELQRNAFTGANVGPLLDVAALDYVNSLRATQKRGERLAVADYYEEVAPFYFPDFESDLRAHLARYAEEDVKEILAQTSGAEPAIRDHEIADLAGGTRPASYLNVGSLAGAMDDPLLMGSIRADLAMFQLLEDRRRKLQVMIANDEPVYRVFFPDLLEPGDDPDKHAVE
ncbi:MAG: DUF547 domain-containing protein [Erythrobacter sp.]|nr:MAG: DUF547 domain-containing protein [Erythrobacter sp.]